MLLQQQPGIAVPGLPAASQPARVQQHRRQAGGGMLAARLRGLRRLPLTCCRAHVATAMQGVQLHLRQDAAACQS